MHPLCQSHPPAPSSPSTSLAYPSFTHIRISLSLSRPSYRYYSEGFQCIFARMDYCSGKCSTTHPHLNPPGREACLGKVYRAGCVGLFRWEIILRVWDVWSAGPSSSLPHHPTGELLTMHPFPIASRELHAWEIDNYINGDGGPWHNFIVTLSFVRFLPQLCISHYTLSKKPSIKSQSIYQAVQ